MEEMGSRKRNSTGKLTRRRSHTRRATQGSFINVAEARREIVNALNLHRSSSSSSSSNSTCNYGVGESCNVGSQYYCSLPLPEPTWSTTAPSVLATPPPPMEVLEFEWAENLASSHTWWLGFLKTLDGNNTTETSKYPLEQENFVIRQCPYGSKLGDPPSMDANDQSSSLDEWLTIPTPEDEGEMM